MYYNIAFLNGFPVEFSVTDYETICSVTQDEYDLYFTGNYIKGSDGKPKRQITEQDIRRKEDKLKLNSEDSEILTAITQLGEMVANQQAVIDELSKKKEGN